MRGIFILLGGLAVLWGSVAQASMTDYPKVRLRSIDKITARTMTFDAAVGTTIKFGSIYIKILACQKPDIQERPEAAGFLQIWEITANDESKWIFSGWMFASSPALSAMDHPIYDVWVIDCLDDGTVAKARAERDAAKKAAEDKALGTDPAGQINPDSATATGTNDPVHVLNPVSVSPLDQVIKDATSQSESLPAPTPTVPVE